MTDPARTAELLRKAAKQLLRALRLERPQAKLAGTQLAVARQYGFSSWRSLKADIDRFAHTDPAAHAAERRGDSAAFLRAVGHGRLQDVRAVVAQTATAAEVFRARGPIWNSGERSWFERGIGGCIDVETRAC